MKSYPKIVCVVTATLFLAACSFIPAKKTARSPVTAYVHNKQIASQGIVIASTKNACVDGFNFLKGLNQGQFDAYSSDYNKINKNYIFLNVNKEIMDQDSKELLSMTLNKKLDTLCTKVQYAGYINVKSKVKALNEL